MRGEMAFSPGGEYFSKEELQMKDWWDGFFDAIGIEERKNKKLQQQMMPLYYQKYMDIKLL